MLLFSIFKLMKTINIPELNSNNYYLLWKIDLKFCFFLPIQPTWSWQQMAFKEAAASNSYFVTVKRRADRGLIFHKQ